MNEAELSSHPFLSIKKLPSRYLIFLNQSVLFRLYISFTLCAAFKNPVIRDSDPIYFTRSDFFTSSSQ